MSRAKGNSRPTADSARRTRGQIFSRSTLRFSMPNATSSPTRDRITCESGSCRTMPMRFRRSAGGTPSTRRKPASSPSSLLSSRPAMPCSSVDLPEPLDPRSKTRSPGSMVKSTSLNAHCERPAWRQCHPCAATATPPPCRDAAVIAARRGASPLFRIGNATARRFSPDHAPRTTTARRRGQRRKGHPRRGRSPKMSMPTRGTRESGR